MLTLACTSRVTPASADGDPASDVLATQSLFMPQDAGVPAGEERRLVEVLSEATRSGHPIRVAVIASAADLGSVTGLWRAPEAYAEFLGEELRLLYTGPLLVVMPDGFGLAGFGASTASYSSQLTRSRMALGAGRVGVATVDAVRRLAGAGGDPLALPPLASGCTTLTHGLRRLAGVRLRNDPCRHCLDRKPPGAPANAPKPAATLVSCGLPRRAAGIVRCA